MNNDVVIVELDRPRKLKFGHTALKTLCALTEKSLEELDKGMDLLDLDLVEKTVYCGLLIDAKENGETIKIDEIPDLLDQAPDQAHVMEKIVLAWRSAFGMKDNTEGNQGKSEKKPTKEKSSTGKKVKE